jgi:Leucine-rich repeat (LRR) protein
LRVTARSSAYARDVLSEIDFSRFTVELQNGRRIEHIGYLSTITNLVLRNDMRDLTPVADLPRLRRLTLRDNGFTTLGPLTRSASLRVLVLDRCSSMAEARPVDLAPLARMPGLRRLVVSGITSKVNLSSLAGVRLHSLVLRGSAALPPGLHVRHLILTSAAHRVKLAGVRGIRSIILDWAPDEDELAMLTALPDLRRLVLWQVSPNTLAPKLPPRIQILNVQV